MIKRIVWVCPIFWVMGCVTEPPNPAASKDHPANPQAAESPLPVHSSVLKIENGTQKPVESNGGQR